MILTGPEIFKRIQKGDIAITPYKDAALNPNSYNLHLHNELMVYTALPLDMKQDNPSKMIEIPPEGILLKFSGHFILEEPLKKLILVIPYPCSKVDLVLVA